MSTKTDRAERRSRRAERKLAEARAKRRRQYGIFGGLVAVAIAVVIVLIVVNQAGGSNLPAVVAGPTYESGIPQNGNTLGNPNAPVKVVEWGDYQCTACGYFYDNFESQFINQYVKTGKVAFTFKDFLIIGPQSLNAAEAAACAQDQGKFWQYHDTLYNNQHTENSGEFSDSRLKQMAKLAGLDTAKFNSCYDSGKYKQQVQNTYSQGQSLGINQTPTFFVNGKNINYGGAYGDLQNAIDQALAK